ADFRCASRSATPVSIDEASMVTATVARSRSPSGTVIEPLQRLNCPRTLAMSKWRTEKWIPEWLLSMAQVSVIMVAVSLGSGPLFGLTQLDSNDGATNED